ncbi:AAA family ATPase [uncultured Methanoregula sp.]|uniref:AAA family ATPase n=1 Tax=uncultured Methanoregula sp. TaxID=1005933 RepID=UPI002AAAF04F|nr:AAA family ATPase [uncultured Methanoregula sp.]
MLWTEQFRPGTLDEIIGQDQVMRHLSRFAASKTVPHLILTGPHGTGKSVAAECFAKALYGENWEQNTSVFPTADVFLQGKAFLEQDERFLHVYQKSQSLITNFKYVIKWYASMRPLDAEFKLIVFEDAHALTRDAQQALRRIMERTSGTCRFILTTTNQSALIPSITSRCLPLFFAPLGQDLVLEKLRSIKDQQNQDYHPCSDDELDLIAQAAQGDLRRAILLIQVALQTGRCGDLFHIAQSETATVADSAIATLKAGDAKGAVRKLESLMIDYGLSGSEVFSGIRSTIRREYNHPDLVIALADAEYRTRHANNEFIQVSAFATGIQGIFP